jgi:AAA domain
MERAWLLDAADLLADDDPGPTPWLIDGLIVDAALVACVGKWKTTKSFALLHLCICIATGRPAFGAFDVPVPGPVVFANEESGRTALWRRLDALARGSAIDREELRGRLMVAANARIRLDDPGWQEELVAIGREFQPRLFALDPLARMKAAGRDENAQAEMGTLIEFIRELRDETGAAVAFVHHTGHAGVHMRGSSDLESVWESRLTWSRDGQAPLVSLASEHREAEPGDPISYRIGWDSVTRSMRFDLVAPAAGLLPLDERVVEWLAEHPNCKAEDVARGLEVRDSAVRRALRGLAEAGTCHHGPSGRRDAAGRPIHDKVWNLNNQAGLWHGPNDGPTRDDPHVGHRGTAPRPDLKGGTGPAEPPDGPPRLGDPMYPVALAEAGNDGVITEDEFNQLYSLHKLIERSREGQA